MGHLGITQTKFNVEYIILVGAHCLFYELFFTAQISRLMEQLDVFISIKPKPKQPSKVGSMSS